MLLEVLVFLTVSVCTCLSGSCREAKLCCPGRDSSCVVQKAPINAIIEDLSDKPCYCDHACLKLGDCCSDFKTACGVTDCVVTAWGAWSECSADCGPGMTSRRRRVQTQPQNGGKHCPSLVQKRACQGARCPHHLRNVLKETAMLLPIGLSWKRKVNETADITKNLKFSYEHEEPVVEEKQEYCVKFEIIKTSKACRKEHNFTALRDGDAICVRCEAAAIRDSRPEDPRCPGHGVEGRTTRWEALSASHCRGKWLRLESRPLDADSDTATCSLCAGGSQFIFV